MPYYRWRGVGLDASYCAGVLFAHSPEMLDAMLFKQEIALLSYKPVLKIYITPISFIHKQFFFEHLQALIDAGIHVWQALAIISEQVTDARFADAIFKIGQKVEQGVALHEALEQYPYIFSDHMVHVIKIGAQADNIAVALKALCQYLQETHQFKNRLRSVLLLPLCTLLVFLGIILVILFAVIPRYVDLFNSMQKELPTATRWLMKASSFVSSYGMLALMVSIGATVALMWRMLRIKHIRMRWDKAILAIGYVGPLVIKVALVHFLRSLSLLLRGGMPLVPALEIAGESVGNRYIKKEISLLTHKIKEGHSLSEAMQSSRSQLFAQDLVLLMTVGQETGSLATMAERAADMYQKQVQHTMSQYTTMVQPALMILLGLLVAGLIFAVYTPLFNLADLV